MKRTQEVLGDLVNYEAVTAIDPLELPTVEKGAIPEFILCSHFERAHARTERTMERFHRKVVQLEERLQHSKNEIASLESRLQERAAQVGKGVGWIDRTLTDRSDPGGVERYNRAVVRHNDAIDQVRRYEERLSDAHDKHNDLIEQHNEAVEEAHEQLEQLSAEALAELDNDIVAFLDRCTQTAARLCDSKTSDDLLAGCETCFIALKIHGCFGDHIDSNTARQEAREQISEISNLFFRFSGNKVLRNSLVSLFRRNSNLVTKNGDLYSQVAKVIEDVDQRELDSMTQSLQQAFGEKFKGVFNYAGIVDPMELDAVIVEINKSIDGINASMAKTKELFESTRATAEAGVSGHQGAETLLATMRTNTEDVGDDLFHKGHFACDMVNEAVINNLYDKELRSAATTIREHLVEQIGSEQLDALTVENEDRYAINEAEATIEQANLLRLQVQRGQVDGHITNSSDTIRKLRTYIREAEQVPRENAEKFRSSTSVLYLVSCFPLLGFIAALVISNKIEAFAAAFRSTNQTYRELGTDIVSKNKTIQMINTVLIFNFIAAIILARAGTRLRSYLGT